MCKPGSKDLQCMNNIIPRLSYTQINQNKQKNEVSGIVKVWGFPKKDMSICTEFSEGVAHGIGIASRFILLRNSGRMHPKNNDLWHGLMGEEAIGKTKKERAFCLDYGKKIMNGCSLMDRASSDLTIQQLPAGGALGSLSASDWSIRLHWLHSGIWPGKPHHYGIHYSNDNPPYLSEKGSVS